MPAHPGSSTSTLMVSLPSVLTTRRCYHWHQDRAIRRPWGPSYYGPFPQGCVGQESTATIPSLGPRHLSKRCGLPALALAPGPFSLQARCPHLGIPLAGGNIEDGIITCSQHKSSWNCTSGESVEWLPGGGINAAQRLISPTCGLAVYETKVENGEVFVCLQ